MPQTGSHQGITCKVQRDLMELEITKFCWIHSICAVSEPKLQDYMVNGMVTLAKNNSSTTQSLRAHEIEC